MYAASMISKLLRRLKYYLIRLFRLKKGAKQIALGTVLGFFPCWFPTFGIGPMLSIALSKFAKANIPSAIISASLGSVLWPILFFLNYKTGALLYAKPGDLPGKIDDTDYLEPIEQVNTLQEVGVTFLVGSLVNSIVFSIVGYFFFYYIFNKYRIAILKKLTKEESL
jgi:uncharacterized protein (DUF2062 family)